MHRHRARPNLRRQRLQKEISFLNNFCPHTQHTALYPRGWAEGRLGPVLIRLGYKASDKALCSVLPGSLLRMSWGGGRGGGNRETELFNVNEFHPPPPCSTATFLLTGFRILLDQIQLRLLKRTGTGIIPPDAESFYRMQNHPTGSEHNKIRKKFWLPNNGSWSGRIRTKNIITQEINLII